MRVPLHAAITAGGRPWWAALARRLLEEEAKGGASKWAGYVEALPRAPVGVAGACLERGVGEVAAGLRALGLAGAVWRWWKGLEGEFGKLEGVEWERWVWAVECVVSRAFRVDKEGGDGGGVFGLLPGVDMLNHSVVLKTGFDVEEGEFVIRCGYGFEEGEEVMVSYGAKTNEDLLFFYGFVEGNSPADAVMVESEGVLRRVVGANRGLEHVVEKDRLLRRAGLVGEGKVYGVRKDGMDEEIMTILRVAFATQEDLADFSVESLRGKKGRLPPLSLENEILAWQCVAAECARMIKRLPKIAAAALDEVEKLREETICSAVWEWDKVGKGETLGEALFVAERREVLEATKARMEHFADVSAKIGTVTTVLLPPTQSLLSATVFDGLSAGDCTSGVRSYSF